MTQSIIEDVFSEGETLLVRSAYGFGTPFLWHLACKIQEGGQIGAQHVEQRAVEFYSRRGGVALARATQALTGTLPEVTTSIYGHLKPDSYVVTPQEIVDLYVNARSGAVVILDGVEAMLATDATPGNVIDLIGRFILGARRHKVTLVCGMNAYADDAIHYRPLVSAFDAAISVWPETHDYITWRCETSGAMGIGGRCVVRAVRDGSRAVTVIEPQCLPVTHLPPYVQPVEPTSAGA